MRSQDSCVLNVSFIRLRGIQEMKMKQRLHFIERVTEHVTSKDTAAIVQKKTCSTFPIKAMI